MSFFVVSFILKFTMDTFYIEEYADVFVYDFCNGDVSAASQAYATRFPNKRNPSRSVFSRTFHRLKETGSKKCSGDPTPQHNIHGEENIVVLVLDNPSISVRRVAMQTGVCKRVRVIGRELKREELNPYHF